MVAARKRAGVMIDSGLDPLNRLEFVPREKWDELVGARRWYIDVEFTKDCRKLVEWVADAEALAGPLGYDSADDLIARGYGLEPEEVRIAVRWLELNDPDSAVGLPEVVGRAQQIASAAKATTGEVRGKGQRNHHRSGEITESVISSRTERARQNGVSIDTQAKLDALARKRPDLLEKVSAKEMSTHRACVEAGIVKEPTPDEKARSAFLKLSPRDRKDFLKWAKEQS